MATLLAMNGGALGDKLIENTISPSLGSMGSWTLSQKAKAAQMGLKLKKLIDKIKHHSPNTKGKIFQKSESGKALAAQTQDELEQKLKKANDEYHELNSLVNEVVREGEDIAAPQSIKDYASHLKFYWAKVRHKRDAQVAIMKERTRKLLCLAPDATLSEKQVEEKYSVCSEDDMNPKKKPILERAKDKAKSLWTRFKNRKNGD
jgi:monomeric isocitrate dehydrogenase